MHECAAAENQRVEFGCSMEQPYFSRFYNTPFDVKILFGKSIFRGLETIMTCECYTNALFLPYNEYQNYEYNIPSQKTDLISFK